MITLVLLPGLHGTGDLFAPFVAALGSEFKFKIVSYPDSSHLGYAELESIARSALPADEAFVLLGESFSGPIAVSLAAARPPHLKGVVLCGAFVRNPRPLLLRLLGVFTHLPISWAPRWFVDRLLLGRAATTEMKAMLHGAISQMTPSVLRCRLRAIREVDVAAELAKIDLPLLDLRATHDRVVPRRASALVSSASSRIKVVEIAAPHLLLQSAPAEAARIVAAFVKEMELDGVR